MQEASMNTPAVCGALLVGLFAPVAHAQPIATERLEATMMIANETRGMPMGSERLQVTIDGQHATTTLTQVYENTSANVIEGQYRLRPGTGSHVDGFAYWNGEQKIVGEVFERQTARQVYEHVTALRRDPGLLEEDGEGRFVFKVFPINPREKKRVELRWTKWLDRRGQTVRYRAPISRSNADIVVELVGPVKNVRSSTHELYVEKIAGGVRVRSDHSRAASELAIDYDIDEPAWTPSAYVHAGGKEDGWFALSLAAATAPANAVAAKDVTLVIDRSGSMNGEPLVHAKAAAMNMIRVLDRRDRVNVISFSDEVDPLFKTPQALEDDARDRALRFVDKLHDGGGTDIALALSTAIASQETRSERPRVVVFLTDGQSDVDKAIKAASLDTGDVRLFTIGLGKDVNKPLLSRLAAQKRGRFVYIETTNAIQPEVARLAASISRPLLVGVSIEVEGAQAIRQYPRSIPDLFAEDELLVTGRLRGSGTVKFTIRGKLAGKAVAFSRSVNLAETKRRPWVGALWAQARVDHVLEDISLGATAPELVDEVVKLALAYNFVTPYTAFLAIPESEMGDQRGTIEAERERKRKIMQNHQDAADLDKAKKDSPDDGRTGLGTSITQNAPKNAPPPPAAPPRDFGGEDEEEPMSGNSKHVSRIDRSSPDSEDDGDAQGTPISASGEVSRKRGCGGCATGTDTGSTLLLGLALGALLLRRRRR
jgi:Ca-activated chloride channel family protein